MADLDNMRRHDKAIESYDEAIRIDPNNVFAWNDKSEALKALGRNTGRFFRSQEIRIAALEHHY